MMDYDGSGSMMMMDQDGSQALSRSSYTVTTVFAELPPYARKKRSVYRENVPPKPRKV
jgi:hypothetical protein